MNDAAETYDEETGEVERPVTALAKVAPLGAARLLALDSMTEAEFVERLAVLSKGQQRMRRIQAELLGVGDFGLVPGTGGKPSLFKAGAEKLLKFYGLVPTFEIVRTIGDGVTAPSVHVAAQCSIHVGDSSGPVIAQGDGTCSTWERKYRFRRDGSENPNPHDLDNTIVKMAVKRALVAGTLIGTATSGLFSQDLEDLVEPDPAALPPSERADRMLKALAECSDLKAFDLLAAEMKPAVSELPEAVQANVRERTVALRKPLFAAAKAAYDARHKPEQPPAESAEAAPDEPPSDEAMALALTDGLEKCASVSKLQQAWAAVMLGAPWAAATAEARTLAEDTMRGIEAALRDGAANRKGVK